MNGEGRVRGVPFPPKFTDPGWRILAAEPDSSDTYSLGALAFPGLGFFICKTLALEAGGAGFKAWSAAYGCPWKVPRRHEASADWLENGVLSSKSWMGHCRPSA